MTYAILHSPQTFLADVFWIWCRSGLIKNVIFYILWQWFTKVICFQFCITPKIVKISRWNLKYLKGGINQFGFIFIFLAGPLDFSGCASPGLKIFISKLSSNLDNKACCVQQSMFLETTFLKLFSSYRISCFFQLSYFAYHRLIRSGFWNISPFQVLSTKILQLSKGNLNVLIWTVEVKRSCTIFHRIKTKK